ncbi:MAG: hypothetical protein KBT03_09465 [Bacteroidales bacterium]|nr:hypothetical protein [Candidatus Scybalousia scybalohippi]
MSETYRLTGDDTFTVWGRTITDLADGDIITVTADNNIASSVVGKNGNMIIAKDEQGKKCTITLRLLKGSGDDKFILNYYKTYEIDSALFILGNGSFSKRLGDGQGNVVYDTRYLKAIHFTRPPYDATSNVNGATDQAVTVYTMQAIVDRTIG